MSEKNILFVFGTRPEVIKLAPLILELKKYPQKYNVIVCNTEQQKELSNQTLEYFGLKADVSLDCMRPNQTLSQVQSRILTALDGVFEDNKIDATIVQGDTMTVLCGALDADPLYAQGTDHEDCWFAGISGAATLGQCTFRSVTTDRNNLGGTFGIFGGRRLGSVFALEASATIGSIQLTAQTCDPFWLSATDHQAYFAPVIDQDGDFYKNLTASVHTAKLALQIDIDLLKIFTQPRNRFSLTVAPQISLVSTKNKITSDHFHQKYHRQNHLGCGAQAAIGCLVSKNIEIQIFGGVTSLSGHRFDNIPKHHHESNLIWDGGIKIAYHFGTRYQVPKAIRPKYMSNLKYRL